MTSSPVRGSVVIDDPITEPVPGADTRQQRPTARRDRGRQRGIGEIANPIPDLHLRRIEPQNPEFSDAPSC
jgi:hypothetical protein